MNETLTVEKDKVLAAAETCETFKGIAKELWPELFAVPHKFKVGDRVTLREPYAAPDGLSGTAKGHSPYRAVGVEFDAPFARGHDLGGLCKDGHGWWCGEDSLSPEEQWEDVTETLAVRPNFVGAEPDAIPVTAGGDFHVPFIVVVNPNAHGKGYKVEHGRAYHRKG